MDALPRPAHPSNAPMPRFSDFPRWLANRLVRPPAGTPLDVDGDWSSLRRAAIVRRAGWAGDTGAVLLEFEGPRVAEIDAADPRFEAVIDRLAALPGAPDSSIWMVTLVSLAAGEGRTLWTR